MKPQIGFLLALAVAFFLQFFAGNFPVAFFAFPLNLLLAVCWLALLYILYKEKRDCLLMRRLLSLKTTAGILAVFMAGCLVIGLFPQLPLYESSRRTGWMARMGFYHFTTAWPFVLAWWGLLSHLALITLRGWEKRSRNKGRFLLIHAGLWLALFCGFAGSSDTQQLSIPVFRAEPSRMAYTDNREVRHVDYDLQLADFREVLYPDGKPQHFSADVWVDGRRITLEVNKPYEVRFGEDLYLNSYDVRKGSQTDYCVLRIVYQPWKYGLLTGILMLLAGSLWLFVRGSGKVEYAPSGDGNKPT